MVGIGMTNVDPETAQQKSPTYLFKIVLLGDANSGKTTALTKFTQDTFNPDYVSTIGVDFAIKPVQLEGELVKLQIWDTAGQERFRTITNSYYRGAQGIVMFFDLTKRESFEHMKNWFEEIQNYAADDTSKIMVGTRADLIDDRQVDEKEIEELAKEFGIDFFEISSKTGDGLNKMFEVLVQKMIRVKKNNYANAPSMSTMAKPLTLNQNGGQNKSKSCVIL